MEGLLEDKVIVDKSVFKEWLRCLVNVDTSHRERMFILQIAAKHGWEFAKSE